MRTDVVAARTISFEVGMQNSRLGAVLARQNFANRLVAIPSAISSLFDSVLASAPASSGGGAGSAASRRRVPPVKSR